MVKALHRVARFCYRLLSIIAVISVLSMLGIMMVEVVRRYILGKTFVWSDEIIRLLLLFCAYFGGAAAYHDHALVSFDIITNKLPERIQDILRLICNVVLTVFFSFIMYYTYKKMTNPSVVLNISTSTGLSGAVPYYGIFVGLIFLMVFTIDFYPELIAKAFGKEAKGEVK